MLVGRIQGPLAVTQDLLIEVRATEDRAATQAADREFIPRQLTARPTLWVVTHTLTIQMVALRPLTILGTLDTRTSATANPLRHTELGARVTLILAMELLHRPTRSVIPATLT